MTMTTGATGWMSTEYESECGHKQSYPTNAEVARCPEIIVRCCEECGAELYWRTSGWCLVSPTPREKPVKVRLLTSDSVPDETLFVIGADVAFDPTMTQLICHPDKRERIEQMIGRIDGVELTP